VLTSHNFNWELAGQALPMNLKQKVIGIYAPLTNKALEKILYDLRTKRGLVLLKTSEFKSAMIPHRNDIYLITLVADQNPRNLTKGIWVKFFGKLTPFTRGPERAARHDNTAIAFGYITKPKRGYYKAEYVLAEEDLSGLPDGELTKRYARYLESVISKSPETYLWTHKRWKHEWSEEYGEAYE
jgi:KDO2-lipid IV(A) lauroyltransferase